MRHRRETLALTAAAFGLFALCGCQTTTIRALPRPADSAPVASIGERERDLYLSVIGQLIEHGKFYAALAHLDEFQRLHGPIDGSRRLRGDAWLAVGALENAEREYAAVAEGKLAGYGKHGLGRVAANRQDWTLAARHFEQAVGEQPTNTRFLGDFANALFELGRTDDAEFQLRKALELSPQDGEASEALRAMLVARKRPALAAGAQQ